MRLTGISALAVVMLATTAMADGPVDDARLHGVTAKDGDWITFGRDYSNARFAPFTQIDKTNVAKLTPAWIYQLGVLGSTQTQPAVVGGVMYVTTAGNDLAAIDAATGNEIWRYKHKFAKAVSPIMSNRAASVAYGMVFEGTDDERVIALDQATGKVKWDVTVPTWDPTPVLAPGQKKPVISYKFKAPPFVYDGKLIVQTTSMEPPGPSPEDIKAAVAAGKDIGLEWLNAYMGMRGFIAALDAKTGAEVWRWYVTKEPDSKGKGAEGGYVNTTPDGMPLNRDIKGEKASYEHYKNSWASFGASPWMPPAFDAELGLLYVTTGNPNPGDLPSIRPGDNLYSNGVAALDAKTGALRWFVQQDPHGQYDATAQPVLIDTMVKGKSVAAVVQCGKAGWCYVMDRATGKLLYRTDEVVPHMNTHDAWNPTMTASAEGIVVSPSDAGGVGVSPVSYDPATGTLFVGGIHLPMIKTLEKYDNIKGAPPLYRINNKPLPGESFGVLTALNLKNGGKTLWSAKTPQPLVGGTLATAGGLVFIGEANGHLTAYDSSAGKPLWSYQTGAYVGAPPISYSLNGRQYVAVATGAPAAGNGYGGKGGGAIVVFALPQ